MTVMALALAHAREHNCDALKDLCVYDSSDEVVGWIGQVMDDTGHPCEHMGMDDEGYTSCWSSSEISRLRAENAKLREELAKARDPQRIGGRVDPESFAYAIDQLREFRWQHATNDDDAIPCINNVAEAHERETAKLRELAGLLLYGMDHEAPPHESLLWSQKVNRLIDGLGIEAVE